MPEQAREQHRASLRLTVLAQRLGFSFDPLRSEDMEAEDLSLSLSLMAFDSKEATRVARRLTAELTRRFASYPLPALCEMTQVLYHYAVVKRIRLSVKGD